MMKFLSIILLTTQQLIGQVPLSLSGKLTNDFSAGEVYLKTGQEIKMAAIGPIPVGTSLKPITVLADHNWYYINYSKKFQQEFNLRPNTIVDFWEYESLKHDVYENILIHGYQFDLRRELTEQAQETISELEENGWFFNDDFIELYLHSLLYKLLPSSLLDNRDFNLSFRILKDPTPNAYALPNGTILITSGLLTTMRSGEELIAVIAHELSHLILDHCIININKKIQRQKSAEFIAGLTTALAAGADVYLATKNENYIPGPLTETVGLLSFSAAAIISDYFGVSFSKEQESDADLVAVRLLGFLHMDSTFLSSALTRIKDYSIANGNMWALSDDGDHPNIDARIASIGVPGDFVDPNYDKIISAIISSSATMEFYKGHYQGCLDLVNRNFNDSLETSNDFLLKANSILRLFDSPEKNEEVFTLLEQSKLKFPDLNLSFYKIEGLVNMRLKKLSAAKSSFMSYLSLLKSEQAKNEYFKNISLWTSRYLYIQDEVQWTNMMLLKLK